jgi:RNA polymerase sigma-70 factor, ECF subfamily
MAVRFSSPESTVLCVTAHLVCSNLCSISHTGKSSSETDEGRFGRRPDRIMYLFFLALAAYIENEEGLLHRLKHGDAGALAELYDAYCVVVYRLILRIVQDPGVAEELVQETFLKLWKRANLLDESASSIGPWIITIARNRALDYLDSSGKRFASRSTQLESIEHRAIFAALDRELMNSPQTQQLREAVGRLNVNQRQVIELAFYEGLSHSEMAARLKQPLGTVKSWVRSALQVLRSDLAGKKGKS